MHNIPEGKEVHHILAHSYLVYFLMLILGVFLDLIFKIQIFTAPQVLYIGIALLILASALIVWAQSTSRNLTKGNVTKEAFLHGPYCYTRTPTHWGLFILVLGFAIVTNAFFVMLMTFISFFITKFIFLKKQEEALAEKYGAPYLEYKKKVKF